MTWSREYTVLAALDGTTVPVPRALYLGDADGPLGTPFYVMERVLGHICRNAFHPAMPTLRRSAGRSGRALSTRSPPSTPSTRQPWA